MIVVRTTHSWCTAGRAHSWCRTPVFHGRSGHGRDNLAHHPDDTEKGEAGWQCPGPDERGACERVAIGEEVPCIGRALTVVGTTDDLYVVPAHKTLCPVTLALALGVTMGRSHEAEFPRAA